MNLLLHCCCAPCSIIPIDYYKKKYDITLFWYNPNIHPFKEYMERLNCLKNYANSQNINLVVVDFYGLRFFVKGIKNEFKKRCIFCYEKRLYVTAKFSLVRKFDAFSTTLLFSPYQNHEKIKNLSEKFAEKFNICFEYKDFREFFRIGQKKARENLLYMQKYCGCIFSEEERYNGKLKIK